MASRFEPRCVVEEDGRPGERSTVDTVAVLAQGRHPKLRSLWRQDAGQRVKRAKLRLLGPVLVPAVPHSNMEFRLH